MIRATPALLALAVLATACSGARTRQEEDALREQRMQDAWSRSQGATGVGSSGPMAGVDPAGDGRNGSAIPPRRATSPGELAELRARLEALERNRGASISGLPVTATLIHPNEGYVGQVVEARVSVVNHSNAAATDIEVTADIAEGLEIASSEGARWDPTRRRLVWLVPSLPGGEEVLLPFQARATRPGDFENCVDLTHKLGSCATLSVLQPALACEVVVQGEQQAGVPFGVTVVARNTGTGTAADVVGRIQLSPDLAPTDPSALPIRFGSVAGGASVERRFDVVSARPGTFAIQVSLEGQPALSARCEASGQTIAPGLEIQKTGPAVRYEGQPITYSIRLASTGSAIARNVVLTDPLPPRTEFVTASDGGAFLDGTVRWSLGDLSPGQSRSVTVTLRSLAAGDIENCATAVAANVQPVRACARTRVIIVPAMQIECIDTEDPVEVGGETVYVIHLTNEGRKTTSNVQLEVLIPDEGEFVEATSPHATGRYDSQRRTVVFSPVDTTQPGDVLEYRVRVRFHGGGAAVCSAVMRFDEFSKPIRSEEGTTIYGFD